MTRLLVTGSHIYHDRDLIFRTLDAVHCGYMVSVLIHGDAPAVDRCCRDWAVARGVPVLPFPADWFKLAQRAGVIRNAQMLAEGKPDLCVAFPGHKGTEDMKRRIRAVGIPLIEVDGPVKSRLASRNN